MYFWTTIIMLLVLAGFGRSYYFRLAFADNTLSGLLHLHGLVMTLWLSLFAAQITFVARRRMDLHRQLGMAGMWLAALVVVVGAATSMVATARDMTTDPDALGFLATPLLDLLVFTILIVSGWVCRRQRDVHGRLMLFANMSIVAPAIGRLPVAFIAHGGAWAVFAVQDLIVLSFVLYDVKRHRRLPAATGWGTLLILASQPARVALGTWPAWIAFAGNLLA
jgi:hypothetical protein